MTWGNPNSDLLTEEEKKKVVEVDEEDKSDLVDPDVDIVFKEPIDIGVQTQEDLKDESLAMENQHLRNYIMRLEERIEHLEKELEKAKEENRKLEIFAPRGVTHFGMEEFEQMWEEEDQKRTIKSAVYVVSKKQRIQ